MSPRLPPWLDGPARLLDEAFASTRPPHALLLRAAEGLGADLLATWIAARVLCRADGRKPCGECRACGAVERGLHPDLMRLSPLEDSKQIRIDEIRELTADLALKSHQGGYKVAIIEPAETLNANSANALLKTLEEPSANTLLVLVTHRRARLPATIVSRCQQLVITKPDAKLARDWLQREFPAGAGADVLRFARGAPLRAVELAARDFAEIDRDMVSVIARAGERALDIPAVAEQWTRSNKADLPDRLIWLETWVTERIAGDMTRPEMKRTGTPGGLPVASETLKIRRLYGVLDQLRRIKITSLSSLNMTMTIENLLLDLEGALATGPAEARSRSGRR